jgi:hypothetical protein
LAFGNRNKIRFALNSARPAAAPSRKMLRRLGPDVFLKWMCTSTVRFAIGAVGFVMFGVVSAGALVATQPKLNWYWIQGAADIAYDWHAYDAAAFWGEFALKNAEALGHEPAVLAVTLNKLARTYIAQGRRKEAAALRRRAASLRATAQRTRKPRSRVF